MERTAATLSIFLALGVIVAAILGPLGFGVIRFHMNHNAIVQYQGSEVVMLAVALGHLIAARLWWQASPVAPALTIGLALFAIYTFVTVVMPQEYAQFPDGNVERYMLLYFGITALGSALIVLSLNALLRQEISVSQSWRTGTQWVLGVQAGLFLLLWTGQILGLYRSGMTTEVEETRLLFWMVKYLDLGFLIPVAFITIVLLQYHQPLAGMLVLGLSGFITVMLVAISAMTISSFLQNEPEGVLPLAAGMLVLALPSALVWWQWTTAAHTK